MCVDGLRGCGLLVLDSLFCPALLVVLHEEKERENNRDGEKESMGGVVLFYTCDWVVAWVHKARNQLNHQAMLTFWALG